MMGKQKSVVEPQVQVQFTDTGLLIATSSGESFQGVEVNIVDLLQRLQEPFTLPDAKKWFECAITLAVDGDTVFMTVSGSKGVAVYTGVAAQTVSTLVRQQWLARNMGFQAPPLVQSHAQGVLPPQAGFGGYAAAPQMGVAHSPVATPRRWKRWVAAGIGAVVIVAGAYFGAQKYLYPKGPGMDLSSLSIDEIAALDSNPGAIRDVQSAAIEAMNAGRQLGAQKASQIEESHIEALKAMGLNPGTSLKNAMGCLAR